MPAPATPRRFTRLEYHALGRTGLFRDQRVELLDGVIWHKPVISGRHAFAVDRLAQLLFSGVGDRGRVRVQQPLAANDHSEPEPDLAVCAPGAYLDDHPDHAWLVVEVALASLATDRSDKAALYAAMGVPDYWVVNLVDGVVEAFTNPSPGGYAQCRVAHPTEHGCSALPDLSIPVRAVLPP